MQGYGKRRTQGVLSCLLGSMVLATSAVAASAVPPLLRTLADHEAQGKYAQAYRLAAPEAERYRDNLTFQYLYGLAANRSHHPAVAAKIFARLARAYPKRPRIQLEYAYASYAANHPAEAKRVLHAVLGMGPPPKVRRNIENLLAKIDGRPLMVPHFVRNLPEGAAASTAKRADAIRSVVWERAQRKGAGKPHLTFKTRFSAGYDTNANSSPADAIINIPILGSLRLDPSARAKPSSFYQLQPGLNGSYPLSDTLALTGSLIGNLKQNLQAHRFDLSSLNGTAGLVAHFGRYQLTVLVSVLSTLLNGKRFSNLYLPGVSWCIASIRATR